MKSVKFVNLGLPWATNKGFTLNTSYYILKSYYKFRGKYYINYTWHDPIFSGQISVEEALHEIIAENPTIICLSMFVWNHNRSMSLAKKIRKQLPNTKIIVGGPNLNAHTSNNFFVTHPFIDYVVYGDGEKPFVEILDSIYENRPINENSTHAVNLISPKKKYPHRVFVDVQYESISSILDCKEDITRDVLKLRKTYAKIDVRWERARGCPYGCSFCDWSSGLHHKVKRKKSNWKNEIDFLFDMGLSITPTDANWGLYKEDMEITKYAVTKGKFWLRNVAKLNKERVFELYDIVFSNGNNNSEALLLSVQDIDKEVLENIERPEIPWEEQKKYITDFKRKFPNVRIEAELIIGMPGQTVDKFVNQLFEFEDIGITMVTAHHWELLPNSPAYNTEYQEKFQMKTNDAIVISDDTKFKTLQDIYDAVEQGTSGWSKTNYITSTNTLTFADIITMRMLASIYNFFKNHKIFNTKSCKKTITYLLPYLEIEAKKYAEQINQTGIWGVYNQQKNKWISLKYYFESEDFIKNLNNICKKSIKSGNTIN